MVERRERERELESKSVRVITGCIIIGWTVELDRSTICAETTAKCNLYREALIPPG